MVQIQGYNGSVEFLRETSWGTRPSSGTFEWFGYVTRASPKSTVDTKEIYGLKAAGGTDRRDVQELNVGLEHHGVTVEFLAQSSIADVLELGMGATTGPADTLTSVSINAVASSGTAEMLVTGAYCTAFEVSCEAGGEVEVSMEFLCQDITESSTTDLDFTSDISGVSAYAHATEVTTPVLDFADCNVQFSGTTLTLCSGFSFKVDNRIEERHYLFGANPEIAGALEPKPVSVTGQITLDMQDTAEWDTLLARAAVTIVITIGSDVFTFNNCKIGNVESPISPEDIISLSIPFTAETLAVT